MHHFLSLSALFLLLSFGACKTNQTNMNNKNNETPSRALLDHQWEIYKAVELKENGSELKYQQPYKVSLDLEATSMSIKLEANSCHTTYTFNADKTGISFTPFRCTKMCCDSKEGTGLTMLLPSEIWQMELVSESGDLTLMNSNAGIKIYMRKMPQIDENFKN